MINFKRIKRDYLITGAFIIALSAFLISIDFMEVWYDYTRQHESWELDELFSIFIAIVTGVALLAVRKVYL